ncbi:MAG: hypothetical protein ACXAC7_12930 [Candidatus Hodarchaeales archaeon]|jgi:signal recognition particle receptor subunit beta
MSVTLKKEFENKTVNAGRILVVGNQASGKTAFATKISALTNPDITYYEDFSGTVQTEYLRANYGKLFALLLPIGGQEKWAKLRSAYAGTAEGMVVVMDSTTKLFWPSSIRQAIDISSRIPYDNYPMTIVISKKDQNELFQSQASEMARIISEGFQKFRDSGLSYHARGYTIKEKHIDKIAEGSIPFSIAEQIIVNSLEQEYFENIKPGFADSGKRKFQEFSLVNCRMFSRAITSAFVLLNMEYLLHQTAILSLLNDMRPTMLELETSWDKLLTKYPEAGSEPLIGDEDLSAERIKDIITKHLLADSVDIADMKKTMTDTSKETGWKLIDVKHSSVFTQVGLAELSNMLYDQLLEVQNASMNEKMHLLEPINELF